MRHTLAMPTLAGPPILILGITQRCGGNFLFDLIRHHPDCRPPAPIREDFLLSQAPLLEEYARRVVARWDPEWGVDSEAEVNLLAHLGEGALSFLGKYVETGRIVSRTPGVESLGRFFKLFPSAKLVILVRDGRAVVESGVRSFGWDREAAIRHWAAAAVTIREFQAAHADERDRFSVVRYEDLYTDTETELRKLFRVLELDPEVYDFGAVSELPVHGSSDLAFEIAGRVHWKPVAKTSAFDPLSRYGHWGRAEHERFNHLAGEALRQFGYVGQRFPGGQLAWAIRNRALDAIWSLRRLSSSR